MAFEIFIRVENFKQYRDQLGHENVSNRLTDFNTNFNFIDSSKIRERKVVF